MVGDQRRDKMVKLSNNCGEAAKASYPGMGSSGDFHPFPARKPGLRAWGR